MNRVLLLKKDGGDLKLNYLFLQQLPQLFLLLLLLLSLLYPYPHLGDGIISKPFEESIIGSIPQLWEGVEDIHHILWCHHLQTVGEDLLGQPV